MQVKRLIAIAALVAAPLVGSAAFAATASAATKPFGGGTPPPPVTTLSCKDLHASIGRMNTWLTDHDSYNNSGDPTKQQDYNDHFDMMGSMQRQGLKAGCYDSHGSPID